MRQDTNILTIICGACGRRAWLFIIAFAALLVVPGGKTAKAQLLPFQIPGFSNASNYQSVASRRYRKRRRYSRRRHRKKDVAPKVKPAWYPDETAKDPVQIIVSLPEQKLTVFQGDKVLTTSRVSSGKKKYETPTGVFSILSKNRFHYSNIYGGAPMPFMQRLTWSGIALHASNSVPNRPASHGCVRMPNKFAPQLFRFTQKGAHVVITNDTKLAPAEVVHDKLFRPSFPAPKDHDVLETERLLAASGVKPEKVERLTEPVRILVTRRTGRERLKDVQAVLNELQFSSGDVDGYMGPDTAKAIKRFQKTYGEAYGLPIDGIVTDELIEALFKAAGRSAPTNGHIYVRQKFRQQFDAPATILKPDVPLGEHLITAQHFEHGQEDVRWLYLSLENVPAPPRKEAKARDPKKASDEPEIQSLIPMPKTTVGEALDRIVIAPEVRERIERMLTPGSSLAISDDGLSKETHPKGTDFVLLTDN